MRDLLREGMIYFEERRFFDAHEAWEDLWRRTSPGPARLFYQGLIQGAVGLYHLSRGNRNGARAQLTKAIAKLELPPPERCPIDAARILDQLRKTLESLGVH